MSSSLLTFFEVGFFAALAGAYLMAALCCWADARRRYLSRGSAQAVLALTLLLPVLGPVLYVLVRPDRSWLERRYKRHYLALLEQAAVAAGTPTGDDTLAERRPAAVVIPGLPLTPEPSPT